MSSFKKMFYLLLSMLASVMIFNVISSTGNLSDSSWAMDFLRPFATVYLECFKTPETAVILSLCMAGLCFLTFFWMTFGVFIPANRAIKKTLDQMDSSNFMTSASDKYMILDKSMRESHFFKERWLKFRKNIAPSLGALGSLGHSGNIDNSPENYFNLELLEAKGVPLRFISCLPGYYVGMGLVLTFMGLVASLYFAGNGMKTGDFNEVRSAFVQLINASTFKFMTSIVGISSSLFLSFSFRVCLHNLESRLAKFCSILEVKVEEINSESQEKNISAVA